MTPQTTHCPSTEELAALIDASLSGERAEACERHLDSCACCQAKLESLAVGEGNLSQVCQQLHDSAAPETSAYWPALKSLNAAVQTPPNLPAARTRDLSLSFLQPATDSAYLGRLAQFDVMRVLGRGGMGIVLEAFDTRLQRNVALKLLDPDLAADEIARQRFCREARAAASITHENVVAVHQVEKSSEGSPPFIVMQLVAGESLEQRLSREKQLPLREVVRIGMQVAHGLAAAHAQSLIHRDIKPGNILLEPPHERVKLTDFGLARVEEDVKLTRTGFVSGTPLYMAPEQALGEAPDQRSDLFSLGAILYEMCAGRTPFSGNSALAILKQISEVKHPPLRPLNPQVPQWLADTIDQLLAKRPSDRIQTAAQLAELLEFHWALMKTSSEDVPTVCAIEQRKRVVRNRWLALGIGAAFLTLGIFGGRYLWHRPAGPEATSVVATVPPLAVFPANAGAVWSVSFASSNQVAAMAVEDGSVRLLDLATKSVQATLNAHRGTVWNARFSPTGQRLVTTGDDGLIKLWNTADATLTTTFEQPNAVRGIQFSSDERLLFAGDRGGELSVWSLDSNSKLASAQQPGAVYAVAISSDDATYATAGSDKVVRLWNAKSLAQKVALEGHAGPIYGLSFHPSGRRLASAGWDGAVRIWDAAAGVLAHSFSAHTGDVWSIAFSPDGSKLVTGGTDALVKVWNAETGQLLTTFAGHASTVHTVAFNHDGTQVASGSRDGTLRIWQVP